MEAIQIATALIAVPNAILILIAVLEKAEERKLKGRRNWTIVVGIIALLAPIGIAIYSYLSPPPPVLPVQAFKCPPAVSIDTKKTGASSYKGTGGVSNTGTIGSVAIKK